MHDIRAVDLLPRHFYSFALQVNWVKHIRTLTYNHHLDAANTYTHKLIEHFKTTPFVFYIDISIMIGEPAQFSKSKLNFDRAQKVKTKKKKLNHSLWFGEADKQKQNTMPKNQQVNFLELMLSICFFFLISFPLIKNM